MAGAETTPREQASNLGGDRGAALKASVVLWTFGLALVAALTVIQGRGTILVQAPLHATFWLVAISLSVVLHTVWRRVQRMPGWVRWGLMAAACGAVGLVLTTWDLFAFWWLTEAYFPQWRSWTEIDVPRVATVWILYTWTFGLNAALFWVLTANDEARWQARRAADAEAAAQTAQLAMLRLQLNPHFLFNTLNAISGLVLERDVEGADRMITRLSDFLRASLDMEPTALVALGDELNTLEAYLQIEAVRFDERLQVTYDCPEALRAAQVPGFILQPLVENTIKHAVAPALRPIHLRISARAAGEDIVLAVTDDGDGFQTPIPRRPGGVGLRNIEARLAALYGADGRLETQVLEPGFRAEIRFPLALIEGLSPAAQASIRGLR
ncbi:MAG: histidine kinase [Phenylobacterium sp.]|nr:histidine kinase [Phenylobacterium sp.]